MEPLQQNVVGIIMKNIREGWGQAQKKSRRVKKSKRRNGRKSRKH
jgi:hypothetical protein